MANNLTRRQWPKGWLPCQDADNGDPAGLLWMDNLHLDEEGALSLVRGTQKINEAQVSSFIHTAYSKITPTGGHWYFIACGDGQVLKGTAGGGWATRLIEGGSPSHAAFGVANGFVIACSGSQRVKDNDSTTYFLTPERSNPPQAQVIAGTTISIYNGAAWAIHNGAGANASVLPDGISFDTDAAVGVVWVPPGDGIDMLFGRDEGPEDTFRIGVTIGDTSKLKAVQVNFLLDAEDNYFTYTWVNTDSSIFAQGINERTTLSVTRRDFERVGGNTLLNWKSVLGVRVSITCDGVIENNVVSDLRWDGGITGPMTGTWKYAQVNVFNTGASLFKSQMSDPSSVVTVLNGKVNLTLGGYSDTSINEVWIFRRDSGENIDVIPPGVPRRLDKWYRVAKLTGADLVAGTWEDTIQDEEAIAQNITWNENLLSVCDLPDEIIGMETNVFGRSVYITYWGIYISDLEDPGLYDSSATLKLSGDNKEILLWIKKTGLGVVYVGSSEDIYELTGTFQVTPDGYVDVFNKPLGVAHPPISHQCANDNSTLFYMAADGVRFVGGAENDLITRQIDLLFQSRTRHGYSPVQVYPPGEVPYAMAVAKDKLWVEVPLQDGTRRLFVYDISNRYWFPYYTDPICLWATEDNRVIAGYGGGSGNYLREIDVGNSLDGNTGQVIRFKTVYDDDGLPRNRKDTFTFKMTACTGGKEVLIEAAKNGSESWVTIGQTSFGTDTPVEKLITIAESVGLGKNFSIRITGADMYTFRLYHFTIEYDPRPEQLTYLRIPYTNLGTISRKRFVNYAFVVDTLGQACEFTPLIDGAVAGDVSAVNFNRKATHIHYFDSEQVGTDIGGILCGFFEFYGVNLEEIVSEKMPVPVTWLRIPQSDYGVPNRKRHSSYKFVINTRGQYVRFTPRIDGTNYAPLDFVTGEKQVVEYFFTVDTIGINIGGVLESIPDPKVPFEFYGPIIPQDVEVLPPRLMEFRIPENNYGHAARKRIRTMPFQINTNGYDVTFTPIVDNVRQPSSTHNTPCRMTTFHYFDFDTFGVDYSGELVGECPFEFYGLMIPETVEVIPVGKKFDQVGPIRLDKLGKIQALRLRVISTGDNFIPIKILNEMETTIPNMTGHTGEHSFQLPVRPNVDEVYHQIIPKTCNGTIFRIEIGPTIYPFHRYDIQLKVVLSGMEATPKWIKVG